MIVISHRGYVDGADSKLENNPIQIKKLLNLNIDVEIDVYYIQGEYFLGHDRPKYKVDISFLKQKGLWCHAKSFESLHAMLENDIHCFWHQSDDFTLTSRGIIWAYPGTTTSGGNTVLLFPERFKEVNYRSYDFICTDYTYRFFKNLIKT